jgi:hypothetical protein
MQSMKRLMLILALVACGSAVGSSPLLASSNPSTIIDKVCDVSPSLSGCDLDDQKLDSNPNGESYLQEFLNVFLFASGIASFIFIILGGVRYITSTGDPARIESAKTTVLYAVIGLIVTFLAIPISAFVLKAAGG